MNENSKSAQKNPSFLDETHLSSSQVNLEIFKTLKLRLNKKSSQSQDTPKFIFPYDSWKILCWDILIVLISLYNWISIPFLLAFRPDEIREAGVHTLNILICIVFLWDIPVQFRTSYIDERYDTEIFDSKLIAKNYIYQFNLLYDIIAAFPFEEFNHSNGQNPAILLRLLKINRWFRLKKFLIFLKLPENMKILVKIANIFVIFIILIHFLGCMLFVITKKDQDWIPPTDLIFYKTDLFDSNISKQYWFAFYHALFYVQGIDVNPRGIELYAFSSAMLLLGAMLSIFIFGEIAFLMTNLNKKQAQFSVVQDQVFTTMKNMKLPDELQLKIEDFLNSSYYYLIKNEEYEKSIQILPPSLKCEVNRILFKDIFMRNVMFVEISQDALDFVLKCLERRFYQPESEVVSQNDDGNEIYFITSGKCQVFVLDEFETNKKTRQLNVGHHFGEVALLYQSKRTASVKTLKYTNLAFLCREDLLKLFEHHPESKDLLIEHTNAYRDPWRLFMRRKFSQISYLRNLPDKIFNDLLLSLQLKIYKTDEYLYKRGDISNKIYVVISGQIEIFVNLRDKSLQKLLKRDKNDIFSAISRLEDTGSGNINLPICLLNHGDILNPESAIVNSELPLSCRASDTARVIELDSAIIHKIAESYYPLRDKVKKCSESMFVFDNFRQERLQKNKPLDVLKFDMRVTSLIKFKNEVIKLVLKTQKRNNAEIPNMRIMLLKLKAILGAEQKGLDEMAKKIGIGEIPIDSLNLLEILQLSEFENPLLTQFASKTKEALIVFQFMCDQFKAIESQIEKFDIDFEQLQMKIIDVHSLLDEAISLTPKI